MPNSSAVRVFHPVSYEEESSGFFNGFLGHIFKSLSGLFQDTYKYREYLKQSIARDLRKQYKRSYLGYMWSMLNPLFMMVILAVVFSSIMRQNIEDYAVFLFAGMITFNYFSGTCSASLGTIRANALILEQVPVPKYIFPLSIAFSNLITFMLTLVPLVAVTLLMGREVPATFLLLPLVMLPLFVLTLGISLILASANMFFEDTAHLTEVVLRCLYFLSPILYARDQLPDWLIDWVIFNPMFLLVEFVRDLVYYGQFPAFTVYFTHLLASFAVLVFGLYVFKKNENKFLYFI